MSDEKTYTLLEAKRELARMECGRHGHDWTVLSSLAGPTAVLCDNCGEQRPVMQSDENAAWRSRGGRQNMTREQLLDEYQRLRDGITALADERERNFRKHGYTGQLPPAITELRDLLDD